MFPAWIGFVPGVRRGRRRSNTKTERTQEKKKTCTQNRANIRRDKEKTQKQLEWRSKDTKAKITTAIPTRRKLKKHNKSKNKEEKKERKSQKQNHKTNWKKIEREARRKKRRKKGKKKKKKKKKKKGAVKLFLHKQSFGPTVWKIDQNGARGGRAQDLKRASREVVSKQHLSSFWMRAPQTTEKISGFRATPEQHPKTAPQNSQFCLVTRNASERHPKYFGAVLGLNAKFWNPIFYSVSEGSKEERGSFMYPLTAENGVARSKHTHIHLYLYLYLSISIYIHIQKHISPSFPDTFSLTNDLRLLFSAMRKGVVWSNCASKAWRIVGRVDS